MLPSVAELSRRLQREGAGLYFAFLLPSLAILGLIVVASFLVGRRLDEGFVWSAENEVIEVDADSPAARAGLQVGDVLVDLEGAPMATALSLYQDKKPGDEVVFSVLRDDQPRVIPIVLRAPSPAVVFRHLDPLIVAFCFWLVSVVVVYLKPTAREGWHFFLYSQIGAGILATGKLSAFNVSWAARVFNVLLCLLGPSLFRFHLLFPVPRTGPLWKSVLVCFYGLAWVLMVPFVVLDPLYFRLLSWYPVWRACVRMTFVLSALASIGLLSRSYSTATNAQIRRQVRLIASGTACAFVPMVFLSILPEMFAGSFLLPYEVTFLGLAFIPLAYAVAIYWHNLLDVDRFLNRSLVHFVLGILWVSLYLLLTWALNTWFPETVHARSLIAALVMLLAGIVLVSLQRKVQEWTDRLFYGGWYDYRSVIAGVSTALSAAQDRAALTRQLVHRVAAAMDLRGAALFLADELGHLVLRDQIGFQHLANQSPDLPLDGHLARLLCREGQVLGTAEIERHPAEKPLADGERAWLGTKAVQLWLPLAFEGELRGLLVLGRKRRDDFFDGEDMRILETLAYQAGLAAENVRLLESLRHRVEELSQLRDELEVTHRRLLSSREEERFRLSRELHDRLLQELFALNMGLRTAARSSSDAPVREQLSTLRRDVLRLAEETRRICAELRPPALSIMGLADAIRSYTEEQARRWGNVSLVGGFSDAAWEEETQPDLEITLDLDQDRRRLSDEVAIALFRVYQETLSNAHRHAAAKHVWVQEKLTEGQVDLSIADDGRGFEPPGHLSQFARQGHFGLLGAQERMAAVGGGVEVISRPGEGARVVAWAPLEDRDLHADPESGGT